MTVLPVSEVRARFKRVKPLKEIGIKERGWTLDVLNVVAAVCDRRKSSVAHRAPPQSWKEFTTSDAYAFIRELERLHPDNPESACSRVYPPPCCYGERAAMSADG